VSNGEVAVAAIPSAVPCMTRVGTATVPARASAVSCAPSVWMNQRVVAWWKISGSWK
jgi:hypothetical protein